MVQLKNYTHSLCVCCILFWLGNDPENMDYINEWMNSSHKFSRNFDKTPAKLKHNKTTCIFYEIYYAYWYGWIRQFDVSQGHYMRSWYLKSHAIRLFVQCLLQANNKDDINGVHYWPFVRGIHQWHEYLPLKGPVKISSHVMQWAFPFHDIYIVYILYILIVLYWLPIYQWL